MTEWQWIVARASGFMAYGLVTLAMIIGLSLTQRWQSRRFWPRIINDQTHQYLILLAGVFTAVHGVSVWLDPFTKFTWVEVVLPFISHYRPLWMGFGIIAAYIGLAVVISGWVRPKIGYAWWRRLHYLNFIVWLLATLHGLGDGSDTRTPWAIDIYAASTIAVVGLTVVRLLRPAGGEKARPKPLWAALAGAVTLIGVVFAMAGPLRPGWNTVANNGHGSGLRGLIASTLGSNSVAALPTSYSAQVQGTVSQGAPSAAGTVTIQIDLTLKGPVRETMAITLQGFAAQGGGVQLTQGAVTLGPSGNPNLYVGQIVALRGGQFVADLTSSSGIPLQAVGTLQLGASNQVGGTVQVQPQPQQQNGGSDGGEGGG